MDRYPSSKTSTMSNDPRNHQHRVGPFQKQQQQSQYDSRMTSFTMNSTTGSKSSSYSVPRSVSNDDDDDDDIVVNENDINYGNVPQLLSTTRINCKNLIPLQPNTKTTSTSSDRSVGSRNSIMKTNSAKPVARSALSMEVGSLSLSSSLLNNIGTNHTNNTTDAKNVVVEQYLLNYEAMVQQQTREEQSVMEHIVPCIFRFKEILEKLNSDSNINADPSIQSKQHHQQRKKMKQATPSIQLYDEISYQQLYQVYNYLQQLKTTSKDINADDTFTQISLYECMTTDRQLMMILRTLTEGEDLQQPHQTNDLDRITWIEFIHCYRICILGMMTLQHLPKGSLARIRVRERSLLMIRLFRENNHTSINHNHSMIGPSSSTILATDAMIAATLNFTTTSTTSASSTIQHLIPLLNDSKEILLTGATNNMDTTRRRRRWLKKRTRRALPYLIVIMILLITFFYVALRHSSNMTPKNNYHERSTVGDDSILEQCMVGPVLHSAYSNTADSPLLGNSEIDDIVAYDFIDNDEEKRAISMMNHSLSTIEHTPIEEHFDVSFHHPAQRQYHPLLGIWSNFM